MEKRNPFKKVMAVRGMGQVVTVSVGLIVLCIVFGILNLSGSFIEFQLALFLVLLNLGLCFT